MEEPCKRTGRGENIPVSGKINHKLRPCHYLELREKNNGTFYTTSCWTFFLMVNINNKYYLYSILKFMSHF